MKFFVMKEAIVLFFYYYSFYYQFLAPKIQRVIWPELMQRLGDLLGQVDKYINRIVAKTPLV